MIAHKPIYFALVCLFGLASLLVLASNQITLTTQRYGPGLWTALYLGLISVLLVVGLWCVVRTTATWCVGVVVLGISALAIWDSATRLGLLPRG